jgi:hypothetical protein
MMIRGYEIGAKLIAYVVGAVLLVGLIAFGLNQCQGRKTADKQAEVSKGQAGASIDSGVVAVETASNIVASDDATDAQVAAAQAEIAAAAKGQKGAAAKRAACRFKAYRDTPQCKEPTP